MAGQSVATIKSPEFINLEQNALNPGISKCEIKVLYLGKNRNGSYIDKDAALKMAKTLPGTPIVGVFYDDKEDFGDHGDIVHIEGGKVVFDCATKPYGFVSPDSKIWFQEFEDSDEFGNVVIRDYLMTNGYLWTEQFPEVERVLSIGNNQSMELDSKNIDGHWANDNKTNVDFFIINDAVFSKLCILGENVEPCFEGASITDLNISKDFNYDISKNLFDMMQELKFALQNKGGSDMDQEQLETVNDEETVEETSEIENEELDAEDTVEESEAEEEAEEEIESEEVEEESEDGESEETDFALQYSELKASFDSLKEELEVLREFKLQQERAEKDKIFEKYHMLTKEDKAEIFNKKDEYTCEQIEEKLALVFVNKNVNFNTVDGFSKDVEESNEEDPTITFSLDDTAEFVPPVVAALRQMHK